MTTTPAEKNALLAEAWKLVGTALRSVSLPEDDYSDLRATCIEAADRAIDSWEARFLRMNRAACQKAQKTLKESPDE